MSTVFNNNSVTTSVTASTTYNHLMDVHACNSYSIQCNTSGASSATLTLQGSNDGVTWITIGTPVTISSSSAASNFLQDTVPTYYWANLAAHSTTGTLALTFIECRKTDTVVSN